jgi:FtsP/CotA-like multicopper oxidase with cupredoxin domain
VIYDGAPVTTDVTVVNASFEIPDCTSGCVNDATRGNYAVGSFEGWTVTGTGGVFQALPYAIPVTDGAQVAWATNGSSLSQVLAEQVSADTVYTLSVQVGQRNDTTRGDATITLLAGGVEIGSTIVPAPLLAGEDWTPGQLVVDTTGMATVSGSLEIRLSGTGGQTEFDTVTLARTGPSARSSRILLRMINAGLENHAPQMLGGYMDVIAEDGHRAPVHKTLNTVFLPAAKSMDVLFTPNAAGVYPLFDRRLRLVNDTAFGGGMFHQIVVE